MFVKRFFQIFWKNFFNPFHWSRYCFPLSRPLVSVSFAECIASWLHTYYITLWSVCQGFLKNFFEVFLISLWVVTSNHWRDCFSLPLTFIIINYFDEKSNSQIAQIWENKKTNICAIFLLTNWWGMWYNEKPVRASVDRRGKSQTKKMTPKGHFFIVENIYYFQDNPNNEHFLNIVCEFLHTKRKYLSR